MFRHTLLIRQVSRASTTAIRPPTLTAAATKIEYRKFSNATALHFNITTALREKKADADEEHPLDHYSTSGKRGKFVHEGQHSRTDRNIRVEYPDEEDLPRQKPVQGRGGFHFSRTLASFSLEGRVGVVTGGARGLGLVMSQALVVSGADVAIVDLNSKLEVAMIFPSG